jgi:hypothetical protein
MDHIPLEHILRPSSAMRLSGRAGTPTTQYILQIFHGMHSYSVVQNGLRLSYLLANNPSRARLWISFSGRTHGNVMNFGLD